MAEGFFKSTHLGAQLATIIPLGLCLGDFWLKKSGAGREAAGDVLQSCTTCICGATSFALLLFSRLAFPFNGVAAAALGPSFTQSEIGETGAGQRSRRICDACRVTMRIAVGRGLGERVGK